MPVYWFALSCVAHVDWLRAVFIFILLHFFLYPSSNGYNSYMDRDEGSIGGIKNPMKPTIQLFYVTIAMDIISTALSFIISPFFAAAFIFYIICSRLYSYRGIRLKRFAILGYIVVIFNQGALTFAMVYCFANIAPAIKLPWLCVAAASLLIGGFYPITQIYQHATDKKDNVRTISMLLGKKGTFIFCIILYAAAFALLFLFYKMNHLMKYFFVLQLFFIPVVVYFIKWFLMVWKDQSKADFRHTMNMNILAATCTNLAFITVLILQQLG